MTGEIRPPDSAHPKPTIDGTLFSIRKRGLFCKIKGLHGDVLLRVAQAKPKIDAEIAKERPFPMKTKELSAFFCNNS